MTQATLGNTVKVHYTGKLEDGNIFDSSEGRDPIEFLIGAGNVIPGFEQAVIGMSSGESKTFTIPSDEAYGPYHDELVLAIAREQIPADMDVQVGQQLQVQNASGQVMPVIVTDVSDGTVTLDANHPLAGEDLTFTIELVDIA